MTDIPLWVQTELNRKIANNESTRDGKFYVFTVTREECGRFDCTVQVWRGRILIETFRSLKRVTWENLDIEHL